jgi:hypothetical protein
MDTKEIATENYQTCPFFERQSQVSAEIAGSYPGILHLSQKASLLTSKLTSAPARSLKSLCCLANTLSSEELWALSHRGRGITGIAMVLSYIPGLSFNGNSLRVSVTSFFVRSSILSTFHSSQLTIYSFR